MNAGTISEREFRPALVDEGQDQRIIHQHVLQGSAQGIIVFNTAQVSPWQEEAARKILGFKDLPENWDSYGSQPPTEIVRHKAIEFVLMVPPEKPQPRILALSGGAIQLEWRKRGRGVQIEFLPDGSIEYLLLEGGNPLGDGGVLPFTSPSVVSSLLKWLIAN